MSGCGVGPPCGGVGECQADGACLCPPTWVGNERCEWRDHEALFVFGQSWLLIGHAASLAATLWKLRRAWLQHRLSLAPSASTLQPVVVLATLAVYGVFGVLLHLDNYRHLGIWTVRYCQSTRRFPVCAAGEAGRLCVRVPSPLFWLSSVQDVLILRALCCCADESVSASGDRRSGELPAVDVAAGSLLRQHAGARISCDLHQPSRLASAKPASSAFACIVLV